MEHPYEKLKFYQDICEIRKFVHEVTERFDRKNMKLISQMRDAARSAKQNIAEGYRRGTLNQFLNYIRISQGSLEELSGDMKDCFDDKLITQQEHNRFIDLYKSASYLSMQYIKAMAKENNKLKWKVAGKSG